MLVLARSPEYAALYPVAQETSSIKPPQASFQQIHQRRSSELGEVPIELLLALALLACIHSEDSARNDSGAPSPQAPARERELSNNAARPAVHRESVPHSLPQAGRQYLGFPSPSDLA